jgi:hypothetical protein
MILLGIEEMETWATIKRAVTTAHVGKNRRVCTEHATEAGNEWLGFRTCQQSATPTCSFHKMGNMLDWQGMLSLCRFKKSMAVMQVGATCDNIDKATWKSNHPKLLCSTMRMLEISELTDRALAIHTVPSQSLRNLR